MSVSDLILPPQQRLFALEPDVTYLNCAYMSPLLNSAQKAGISGLNRKNKPWTMGSEMFFKECEQLRALAAKMVGSDSDHIALIAAASYGLSVAARNLAPQVQPGENILILAEQFPSNVYVWQAVARERSAQINVVPVPKDGNWTAAIIHAINDKTRILALPNCHWTDGTLVDLAQIRRHIGKPEQSPFLVLDLTQSLGALPFSVTDVQPDFMVSATYKWGLCPYGMGVMYVADRFLDGEPIEYNWVNRYRSEDLTRLVEYCDDYQKGARRFDVGQRSNPIMLPMAIAAFRQLLDWDIARIHATLTQMNDYLASSLQNLPLTVADKPFRSGHMIGLHYTERWPDVIRRTMVEAGIHVSYRSKGMRISPHVYNTMEDIDRLIDFLRKNLKP